MIYVSYLSYFFPLDHSFLGFEWQKRWCALSKTVFYYYGSDKGNVGVQIHQFLLHENLGLAAFSSLLVQSKLKTGRELLKTVIITV